MLAVSTNSYRAFKIRNIKVLMEPMIEVSVRLTYSHSKELVDSIILAQPYENVEVPVMTGCNFRLKVLFLLLMVLWFSSLSHLSLMIQ